jgi:hypothetical protein
LLQHDATLSPAHVSIADVMRILTCLPPLFLYLNVSVVLCTGPSLGWLRLDSEHQKFGLGSSFKIVVGNIQAELASPDFPCVNLCDQSQARCLILLLVLEVSLCDYMSF